MDVLVHVAPNERAVDSCPDRTHESCTRGLIPHTDSLRCGSEEKAKVSPEENQMWIDAAVQQLKAYSAAGDKSCLERMWVIPIISTRLRSTH